MIERDTKQNKKSLHYVSRTILAGGLAGCCAKTCIAPLERVKILFQGNSPKVAEHRGSIRGAFRTVHMIGSSEGVLALFRGNFATIVRIFPYAAIQYAAFEQCDDTLGKLGVEGKKRRFLAGACAGAISVTITYPLDLIRARLAFQSDQKYNGLWHAIVTRVKLEGGPMKLYSGFLPTFLGILPYAGTSFMTYGTLKNFFRTNYPHTLREAKEGETERERELRTPVRLLCGGVAGAVGQTVAYPLDVVRRRMQVCGVITQPESKIVYRRMGETARHIIQTEGIRGLYMGLTINYVKVAPAVGISFVMYERIKKLLGI